MKTAAELILKGHFSDLKEQLNHEALDGRSETKEDLQVLERILEYFNSVEQDVKVKTLQNDLLNLLNKLKANPQMPIPEKMPMQKAKGKKKNTDKQSRTGT